MTIKKLVFISGLIASIYFTALAQKTGAISVDKLLTENGFISGKHTTNKKVMVFKGIPYAAPPTGELRWKEPQPVKKWDDVRKCETFGPNAMQGKPVPFGVYTAE